MRSDPKGDSQNRHRYRQKNGSIDRDLFGIDDGPFDLKIRRFVVSSLKMVDPGDIGS